MSSATKQLMRSFGSEFMNNLEFRDAFVMIGQQNLVPPSKAIEQVIVESGFVVSVRTVIVNVGCQCIYTWA